MTSVIRHPGEKPWVELVAWKEFRGSRLFAGMTKRGREDDT
jgi:hypothetical protein